MQSWMKVGLLPATLIAALHAGGAYALGAQTGIGALTRGVAPAAATLDRPDGSYSVDGVALSLGTPAYTARAAAPEAMAREYLAARQDQLGLEAGETPLLKRTALRQGRHLSVVRFEQRRQGLPVYGSDVAVTVQPNGRVLYVANNSVRNVADVDVVASKSPADALAIAAQYLGSADFVHQPIQRMVYAAADGSHLVLRVTAAMHDGSGDWELLIDAHTGNVLRAEDKSANETGNGTIWTPDPLSYERETYGHPGYVDGNNADTQQLTDALVPVTLDDITLDAGMYKLAGPWAVCAELETPTDAACPVQASSDFSVTRHALTFDSVMSYFHISAYLKYVNDTLGVPAMPLRHPGGIKFDAHGFQGADNSHYIGSTEVITFGEGGVDDAQDADVLIHELGHAIHDFVTAGHLSQTEGLSEGVGDYNAGAYSRDFPNQWTPADAAYNWVYSWDGHSSQTWPGRILNYQVNHTYAQARTQEIHTAGQYWSSCNLVARTNLQALDAANGAIQMDRAYFTGLSMTGSSTTQKAAAQAIINAAAALGYTAAQVQAFASAYNDGNTGGHTSCDYAVTVPDVGVAPVVDVDTTPLDAAADAGASTTATLAIGNTGTADLTWTIDTADAATCATSASTPWLSFDPAAGTVATGAADASVTVTFDATTLAAGSYTTNLCVHSNDAAAPVVAVPVTFTVNEGVDDTIFADGFDTVSNGTCAPTQLFEDASFEASGAGTSTVWTSVDSVSGTNLCDASCDDGGTIVAHTGEWFAWFGGWDQANTSTLSQSVVFPAGQARWLNYWLINQIGGDPTATFTLSIDGTVVLTVAPESGGADYLAQTFEIPALYLDGASHAVEFDFAADSAAGEVGGAIIDDVTLDCSAQPVAHASRPTSRIVSLKRPY